MSNEINVLRKMGVTIIIKGNNLIVKPIKILKNINISTKPYPGFPTDLQAQIMVLMTKPMVFQKLQKIYLKIVLCMFQN